MNVPSLLSLNAEDQQRSQPGIFANAKNTVITGGQFYSVINSERTSSADGFQSLQEHVASSAFHDSAQRVDPPRCHENTRQAVIQEIFDWIEQEDDARTTWIAWLNGAAGAGKSAICQTVAEMCIARRVLVASFFFFRTDPTRNTIAPLISTLAYQIIRLVPETKHIIAQTIEQNPLVYQQGFASQLEQLIVQPLLPLVNSRPDLKLFLIIDGVDECDDYNNQKTIITSLATLLKSKGIPIIVLFGSRQEVQIQVTFNSPEVSNILLRLPLDSHYLPDDDIRLFLNDGFRTIHQTHPFSVHLDKSWPGEALVEEIVEKSSGQFIYASVVMRFVSSPRSNPASQLEIVRGLRPIQSATPFAQLDALYRHIFSRVEDLHTATIILTYSIIGRTTDFDDISAVTVLSTADISIALVDLISVISCEGSLRFLHASLPDFLIDRTRSLEYSVSEPIWSTRVAILWYRSVKAAKKTSRMGPTVNNFLKFAQPTSELKECVASFNPELMSSVYTLVPYITCVQALNFEDDGHVYYHQLKLVTKHIMDEIQLDSQYASELTYLGSLHDISGCLSEIEQEKNERLARSRTRRLKEWLKKRF